MEPFYPLHAYVCEQCFLVQLEEYVAPGGDLHRVRLLLVVLGLLARACRRYVEHDRDALRASARIAMVIEIASNDGYLLQHFVARGRSVLGIEPAANVAKVRDRARGSRRAWSSSASAHGGARRRGAWPGRPAARQQRAGARAGPQRLRRRHEAAAQARAASITMEFPHLCRLIDENQFDTIYHEHFSYFSFLDRRDASSPRTG